MQFTVFFFAMALAGLTIASYTDLKERIVRNKLSYSLIAIGLGGHAILSVMQASPWPIIYSGIGASAAFGFAWLLWKMGVWAGGDVKLLTGIAALAPYNTNILAELGISVYGLNQTLFAFGHPIPIFFLSMFVFSVFAMVPYGILIALNDLAKVKEERQLLAKESWEKAGQTLQLTMAVVGFSWLLLIFGITQWLLLPILLALGFVKSRKLRLPLLAGLFLASIFFRPVKSAESAAIVFMLFFGLYLLFKLYAVSKKLLKETKKITELEEGDIIAESFIEQKKGILRVRGLGIKRIINYLVANKLQELLEQLQPRGRVIASSRKARGVTEEEISELKKLVEEKKVEDVIEVKLSAPFVPAMLIAFIALNVIGDALWLLVF